jgi:hypothetical protein
LIKIGGITLKVQKVTLKEFEIVEVEGDFEKRFINEKNYPAFLTNASVKRGFETGLIETSLWEDLLKIMGLQSVIEKNDEESTLQLMNMFDEQKLIAVVYLGVLGANKNVDLTFDSFIEKYHYDLAETIEIYANLITNLVTQDPNQFAKGLQQSTKSEKKNSSLLS